jgi:hypothetical protein
MMPQDHSAVLLDISPRILSLARAIERACRVPGRYTISLEIPAHPRAGWNAQIARSEMLQLLDLDRRPREEGAP